MTKNNTIQEERANLQSNNEIDLRELFFVILDGRYIISFLVLFFAVLATVYALLQAPIYKANIFVLIEDNIQGIPGLDDTAEMITSDSSSAKELFFIKSRLIIGKVVDELNLTISAEPIHLPFIGAAFARRQHGGEIAEALFGFETYAWGGEKINVSYLNLPQGYLDKNLTLIALEDQKFSLSYNEKELLKGFIGKPAYSSEGNFEIMVNSLIARPGTQFKVQKLNRHNAILKLQSSLSVKEKEKSTNIIEIAVNGGNRDSIVNIVNSVAKNYYLQSKKSLALEAESSLIFIDQQIKGLEIELSQAEKALNDFKSENNSVDIALETAAALDSLIQIEADINSMSINEANISRRFMPEHPNYVSFKLQQQSLFVQRDKVIKKLEQLPNMQREILSLTRDFETTQSIFLSLDNRRRELDILKASTVGNVQLLDKAGVIPGTLALNSKLIVVLGILLGGMLGTGIILLRFFLKAGIIDPQTFTEIGLTVRATIPYSENEISLRPLETPLKQRSSLKLKKRKLDCSILAHDYPDDLSIEALRGLRTSLRFLMSDSDNRLIMISSGSPAEGKSFVVVNLAALIAKSGKRVLIVDADMRKSYLHHMFGMKPQNGLAEVLAGTLELGDAMRETAVNNLYFMTRGEAPANPSELLMDSRFEKMAKKLNEKFDIVIFDTPPILAVTDASIIGNHCSLNMMVARFDACSSRDVLAAKNRFQLSGVDINGIVFNAVQNKSNSYYYDDVFKYGSALEGYYKTPIKNQSSN
ncbi:polysaccharide biosynthesis tyrosine autokinase [Gammaproteobacteria bacterium]|nr:polysaccharide biosynthesis tyrosine autokinase [Gammaproteobacteria bacterium]